MQGYLEDLFGLSGKTAVVTGGGGTLGGAIALAFARAGARVVLWGHTAETLERRAQTLREACGGGARIDCVRAELLEEVEVASALRETLARAGGIDVLVNACGGNRGRAPITETAAQDFEAVLRLNLLAGCWLPSQQLARHWQQTQRGGAIIHVASMAAHVPLSGVAAYSAAKAGVLSLTQSMARDLAPHGIRVNAISPGFFLADQNRALLVDEGGAPTARGRRVLERTPCGRFGEPDELAGACLLLASERAAGFITGAVLAVDGGFLVDNV
jgi:NAD(P)-dependent dehydrogenase (short-subunit alcohol dehydrogenase family)